MSATRNRRRSLPATLALAAGLIVALLVPGQAAAERPTWIKASSYRNGAFTFDLGRAQVKSLRQKSGMAAKLRPGGRLLAARRLARAARRGKLRVSGREFKPRPPRSLPRKSVGRYRLRLLRTSPPETTTTTVDTGSYDSSDAPRHLVAVQGPTDPADLYVHLTWDRSDPDATGYEVLRDGQQIGTVEVSGDTWDDLAFRDRSVQASRSYSYEVRARFADGSVSVPSPAYTVYVRSNADIGPTFRVDDYSGTDLQRAEAAVSAARSAGGGVVLFDARTYTFSGPLTISAADDVVLRGAGRGATTIRPGFAGYADSCGASKKLIVFAGARTDLGARASGAISRGQRTVSVSSTSGLSPGKVVIFDASESQVEPSAMEANGVVQDPGGGRDERYRWEANEIAAVSGSEVTFKYPFSQPLPQDVHWQAVTSGYGDGIERMTIEGMSVTDQTYYQLVNLDHVAGFTAADIEARWANRNIMEVKGYDIDIVDVDSADGGAAGYGGICKYKFTIFRTANLTMVGMDIGSPDHDRNGSAVTIQKAQRVTIRDSRFYRSQTYAVNEHGGGSRDLLIENNYIAAGPTAKYGGVLLGNNTWGFSGSAIVRNNTFEGNPRDLYLMENSFEVRFLDNTSRGNTYRVVDGYGWAGPDTSPDLYGSLRLTVARNEVSGASGAGVVLGYAGSPWYPYTGVRDVLIADNRLGTAGRAVELSGDASSTGRLTVVGNSGTASYQAPPLGSDDVWSGNADGVNHNGPIECGEGTTDSACPAWSRPKFDWEAHDTS